MGIGEAAVSSAGRQRGSFLAGTRALSESFGPASGWEEHTGGCEQGRLSTGGSNVQVFG